MILHLAPEHTTKIGELKMVAYIDRNAQDSDNPTTLLISYLRSSLVSITYCTEDSDPVTYEKRQPTSKYLMINGRRKMFKNWLSENDLELVK